MLIAWIGWPEIVVILVVVLLLFGGKKLPELARGIARGLKSFKKEMNEVKGHFEDTDAQPPSRDEESEPKTRNQGLKQEQAKDES
jgi:sec-independent protein translocase protein TatA